MRLFTLLILISLSSWGQLSWEDLKQEIPFNKLTPEVLKGEFPFQNSSDHIVEVTEVKVSCGCTKVKLKKKLYLPGEKGVIPYSISLKGKTQTFSKSLTVYTSHEKKKKQLAALKHSPH